MYVCNKVVFLKCVVIVIVIFILQQHENIYKHN